MGIALSILIGVLLLFLLAEFAVFLIAFRSGVYRDLTKTGELDTPKFSPYKQLILDGVRAANEAPSELVSVRSFDGLTLRGRFYKNERERGLVLLCHGYRSIAENDFSGAFDYFVRRGLSILLIDQRAHGRSEGRVMTFGIRERHDVHTWVEYLTERFPGTPIVVEGISMGAATVLMASGEGFPEAVRGLIADCGYNSPKDSLCHVIRRFHGSVKLLYPMARLAARLYGGFDLEECSAEEEGRKSRLPCLFIHGEKDYLVPFALGKRNYEAYGGPKTLVSVPAAGHGMSYLVETPRVEAALDAFLDGVLNDGAPDS